MNKYIGERSKKTGVRRIQADGLWAHILNDKELNDPFKTKQFQMYYSDSYLLYLFS